MSFTGQNTGVTVTGNYFAAAENAVQLYNTDDYLVDDNEIIGKSLSGEPGIEVDGGYGVISNNTLLDADGGIYLTDAESPPPPVQSLCSIGENSYRYSSTCSWTAPAGEDGYC